MEFHDLKLRYCISAVLFETVEFGLKFHQKISQNRAEDNVAVSADNYQAYGLPLDSAKYLALNSRSVMLDDWPGVDHSG